MMGMLALAGFAAPPVSVATAETPDKRVDHTAPVRGEEWMNLRRSADTDILWSSQQLHPEGQMLDFGGRLCSLALARDHQYVLVKTSSQLVSVAADKFQIIQETSFPVKNGGSMHGLTVAADGQTAYVTGGKDRLFVVNVAADGKFEFARDLNLADDGKPTNPLGVALTPDGRRAVVAR